MTPFRFTFPVSSSDLSVVHKRLEDVLKQHRVVFLCYIIQQSLYERIKFKVINGKD